MLAGLGTFGMHLGWLILYYLLVGILACGALWKLRTQKL